MCFSLPPPPPKGGAFEKQKAKELDSFAFFLRHALLLPLQGVGGLRNG